MRSDEETLQLAIAAETIRLRWGRKHASCKDTHFIFTSYYESAHEICTSSYHLVHRFYPDAVQLFQLLRLRLYICMDKRFLSLFPTVPGVTPFISANGTTTLSKYKSTNHVSSKISPLLVVAFFSYKILII